QVEDQILDVPQTIFDLVAEDPKEEHVSGDMRDAAVHEHRSNEREVKRNRRQCVGESFVCSKLLQKNKNKDVDCDEQVIDPWCCLSVSVVVVQWKNHGPCTSCLEFETQLRTHRLCRESLIYAAIGGRYACVNQRRLVWSQ